jgi:hypothetical protein
VKEGPKSCLVGLAETLRARKSCGALLTKARKASLRSQATAMLKLEQTSKGARMDRNLRGRSAPDGKFVVRRNDGFVLLRIRFGALHQPVKKFYSLKNMRALVEHHALASAAHRDIQ